MVERLYGKRSIILWLSLLLALGFLVTTLASYQVSRAAIRESIAGRELPLTADNIYSEIQKDLIRPVLVSSTMASDTFLRDWVLHGEQDVERMTRYLAEVKERYGAFTTFFVSERSGHYYHPSGIVKKVSREDPRDAWYFRVRSLASAYEINVDPDQANRDALTIFVNYRVLDYQGRFIGVAGVGLTVEAVRSLIGDYQRRFQRNVYFVSRQGKILLFGKHSESKEGDVRQVPGLRDIADQVLAAPSGSYAYAAPGHEHLLSARLVPELDWYLFVEKSADEDLARVRRTLYVNLAIAAGITLVILLLANLTLDRYQGRLEEMATTDHLTGLLNRQASELLFEQAAREFKRRPTPLAVLLLDIDHFKAINDRHGHLAGDRVLEAAARLLRGSVREADVLCRWGGEEFLVLLKGCDATCAGTLAEKLRQAMAAAPIVAEGSEVAVTLSVGMTSYGPSDTPDSALARADEALYAAKEGGRNRVCVVPVPAAAPAPTPARS